LVEAIAHMNDEHSARRLVMATPEFLALKWKSLVQDLNISQNYSNEDRIFKCYHSRIPN